MAPVPGKRSGVNYLATVTGTGVLRFMAVVLLAFLARLPACRPGKVYVILDDHPSHRARKVAARAAERADRLRLAFLPP